jgi:integrase
LHKKVGKESGPYEANRFLALLSKMFSLAVRWGFLPENAPNPARGIERFREQRRDRWVTPTEMPRLIDAIQAEPDPYHRAGLLLYLLTGLRNKELIQIPWSNIDLKRQEILLPDTKAGRSFVVKLSPAALQVFIDIPRTLSPWVFPSPDPAKPLAQFPRKAWDRVRQRAGMPDLRIHDLRRTFGSWLATQGTPLKVIAALLNQTSQSITDTVYAHLADDPLREATASVGDNLIRFTKINEKAG